MSTPRRSRVSSTAIRSACVVGVRGEDAPRGAIARRTEVAIRVGGSVGRPRRFRVTVRRSSASLAEVARSRPSSRRARTRRISEAHAVSTLALTMPLRARRSPSPESARSTSSRKAGDLRAFETSFSARRSTRPLSPTILGERLAAASYPRKARALVRSPGIGPSTLRAVVFGIANTLPYTEIGGGTLGGLLHEMP